MKGRAGGREAMQQDRRAAGPAWSSSSRRCTNSTVYTSPRSSAASRNPSPRARSMRARYAEDRAHPLRRPNLGRRRSSPKRTHARRFDDFTATGTRYGGQSRPRTSSTPTSTHQSTSMTSSSTRRQRVQRGPGRTAFHPFHSPTRDPQTLLRPSRCISRCPPTRSYRRPNPTP